MNYQLGVAGIEIPVLQWWALSLQVADKTFKVFDKPAAFTFK